MATNWNPDLISPESEIATILVQLDPGFSKRQLQMFKVALLALDIECIALESCEAFVDVFRLLEQKVPDQAVSVAIKVSGRIGISERHLEPLKPFIKEEFSLDNKPIVDLVLTLGEILMNMTNEIYRRFLELVCRSFLPNYNLEGLSCRAKFLGVLLSKNLITLPLVSQYFDWTDRAGCSNQLKRLRMFCARHNIQEPPCYQVSRPHTYSGQSTIENVSALQCTDDGTVQPQIPGSLPALVSQDGGTNQGENGASGQRRASSKDSGNVTRPFQSTVENDKDFTTAKATTDHSELHEMWDEPIPPTSDDKGSSTLVICDQHTQAPPPHLAQTRGTPGERRSVTDTCNTEDIQDQPDRTKSAPINIASSASNSQHGQTNLKDVASATVPTEPSEPTEPPIPTLSATKKKQCFCKALFGTGVGLIITIIAIVSFSVFGWYSTNKHILGDDPKPSVGYVGSNTTNLLGCFDSSVTSVVRIIESETSVSANYDAKLYKVTLSSLTLKTISLDAHRRPFEEIYDDQNVPVNYWYGDAPLYVASHGKLALQMVAVNHGSSSPCSFQFYLFKTPENYHQFLDSGDTTPAHYFQTSGCFPIGGSMIEVPLSFNFTLPSRGFYYIAARIEEHVEVNVTIGGTVTSYDVSNILHEDCSLNYNDRQCTIEINPSKIPTIHVSERHLCILAKSTIEDNKKVNITVVTVHWNGTSIMVLALALVCMVSGSIFLIASFVHCCIKVRGHKEYHRLETTNSHQSLCN